MLGMLFVYTDGIAEAHNEKDELFEMDRIGKTLNSCSEPDPAKLIEVMRKGLNDFKGNRDQFDDITMLAVKNK
ncbi:MAG: SpoIIE family protein phosphatase [Lachnospiraceae bacterium]|nr:SpoIIE family protein phosphatase [Lachnospiraceae bacterium]